MTFDKVMANIKRVQFFSETVYVGLYVYVQIITIQDAGHTASGKSSGQIMSGYWQRMETWVAPSAAVSSRLAQMRCLLVFDSS